MDRRFAGMTVLFVVCCLVFADTRTQAEDGKEKRGAEPDPAATIAKVYRNAKLKLPTAENAAFYTGSVTFVTADNDSNFVFVVHSATPSADTTFTIKPTTAGGEDMKKIVLTAYAAGRVVSVYSADASTPLLTTITREASPLQGTDRAARRVRVHIENHITNDIRVGIFGWGGGIDYRQDIAAGEKANASLFTGWRGIVVWDNNAGEMIPAMGGVERFDCQVDHTIIKIKPNKIEIIVPVTDKQ